MTKILEVYLYISLYIFILAYIIHYNGIYYKKSSKKIHFLKQIKVNIKYWVDETTLLKLHVQVTYKQNVKQCYKHTL